MEFVDYELDFYFVDTTKTEDFYKLTDFGRLYKYDFTTLEWVDVTYKIQLDAAWEKVTEKECKNLLLKKYINHSVYNLRNHPELFDEDTIPPLVGRNYDYVGVYSGVYAIDKQENVFLCEKRGLVPSLDVSIAFLNAWNKIPSYFVMDWLVRVDEDPIDLYALQLYRDKENNIIGIKKETKEAFMLSKYTGNLDRIYEYNKKELVPIQNEDPVWNINNLIEYDTTSLLRNRVAQDILYNYKKQSEKENNEKYGKELTYYIDYYGKVFAEDENENVYRLDQDGMYKVDIDISDIPFYTVLEPKDVMPSIVMHDDHITTLGKKRKLNISEVLCYEDDDDIYGITENGKYWYLNQDTGEFESILKKDFPKGLTLMEDPRENVIFQAELRRGYEVECYAKKYGENLDNLYSFFVKEGNNGIEEVYGTDIDYNEYLLTSSSITPVKKGTIEENNLTEISEFSLFIALEKAEKKGV